VFSPRTHNECLDVTIGSLPVVEDAPREAPSRRRTRP